MISAPLRFNKFEVLSKALKLISVWLQEEGQLGYQEGDEEVGEAEVDQQQIGRRVLQLLLDFAQSTNKSW